jgi:type I restriction enzyme, S subunit
MIKQLSNMDKRVDMFATVPKHWTVKKLGYLASLKSGETITSDIIEEQGLYPVYGGNGLRGYTESFTHSGDLVLIGRQGALCGNINYAHGDFWASEHAVVATPLEEYDYKWLGESLRAMNLNQYSLSAAQPGISIDRINSLKIAVPPLNEQQRIADYLDRETTEIDALIAAKEHMLTLLDEKREALISYAVTRGIDPSISMKPSGLDWIGDIPQHWNTLKVKFLIHNLEQGSSPQASNIPPDELGILKLSAISKGRFIRHENKALQQADDFVIHANSLRKGDVLITRGNTPQLVGDVCVVPEDEPHLLIPDLVYRLTVRSSKILPEFLCAFLITPQARSQIQSDARGSSGSMVKISQSHISDWRIPVPPILEQEKIVSTIEDEQRNNQKLVSNLVDSITLLKERRSALITAAVTGQIKLEDMVV